MADGRGAQTLRPTRGRSQREDDDYADDGYLDSPRSRYDEDDYGESRRAGPRGRSGYGAARYSREDERERTGDMRARGREYDARLAMRASASYNEREGSGRQSGGRPARRRDYSYDPDDPDGGRGGRSFGDAMSRYRAESRREKKRLSADTVMLGALAIVAIGSVAFCAVKYLK